MKNSVCIRNLSLSLSFTFSAFCSLSAQQYPFPEKDQRPNIVLFLVDDMGWQDTSLILDAKSTKFNEIYQTPNMEVTP